MYEDFVDCNGGNRFLSTLLVGITEVKAEVSAFDPEGSICFRSETLQYYFVGLECAYTGQQGCFDKVFPRLGCSNTKDSDKTSVRSIWS